MLTTELVEYKDDLVCFKYPKGLRQKPFGHQQYRGYFFRRPKPRNRPELFETLLIEIDPPKSTADFMRQLMGMPLVNWDKAHEGRIVASGKSKVIPRAIEHASTLKDSRRGVEEYRWDLLFRREGHVIYIQIFSTGDFEQSRPHWVEVIQSIHFVNNRGVKKSKGRRKQGPKEKKVVKKAKAKKSMNKAGLGKGSRRKSSSK